MNVILLAILGYVASKILKTEPPKPKRKTSRSR